MGEVKVSVEGFVATITVSRPEKLNAFDIDMLKALAVACDRSGGERIRACRDPYRRGQGLFGRRRHQSLGRYGGQ